MLFTLSFYLDTLEKGETMKRYVILISSVLIQMVLGSIYAWSTLASGLQQELGFTGAQTQSIYGTLIIVFSFSLILGGWMFRSFGPRVTGSFAGLVYTLSFAAASLSQTFPSHLLLIGFGGGLATGLGYACPLSTGAAWFPKHKGLVTGIAVFGFGAGSIATNYLFAFGLTNGMTVSQIFMFLGYLGGGVVFLAAQVLDLPKTFASSSKGNRTLPTPKELFVQPAFWKYIIALGTGSFAGLIIIGSTAGMVVYQGLGTTVSDMIPVLGVTFIALGNASGRIAWGWFQDKTQGIAVPLNLVGTVILSLLLLVSPIAVPLFLANLFLVGFFFGGSLIITAADIEKDFGTGSLAAVYPWVFIFYGFAALLGPTLAGSLLDAFGTYTIILIISSVVPALGFVGYTVFSRIPSPSHWQINKTQNLSIVAQGKVV